MIAEKLRELAAEAERETRQLMLPREKYTLSGALSALQATIPDKSIAITLAVWGYRFTDEYDVRWTVWDGTKNYEGKTLTATVAACLAANGPADTLDQVQEAINPPDGVITADFGASTHGEPAAAALE